VSKPKFVDPRGGHLRIYWNVLDAPAWAALSYSQQALFIAMRRRLTANSNGNIAATVAGLREQGFAISSSTLASGLRALAAVGLIAVAREGGKVGRGQAIPTLYRFTDYDMHEWPKLHIAARKATNEWSAIGSIEAAKRAINDAEKAATEAAAKASEKKLPLRNSKRDSSIFRSGTLRKSKSDAISGFENRSVNGAAEWAASLVH